MNNKVESNAVWSNINGDAELNMSSNSNFTTNSSNKACYKCGGIIPAESEFCGYCGIKLSQDCPKCNNRYSSQFKFCPKCGTNKEEYLLAQLRFVEDNGKDCIKQDDDRKQIVYLEHIRSYTKSAYKENNLSNVVDLTQSLPQMEYNISRRKICYAPNRFVYKTYYEDSRGVEIETNYLGQWYEDEHGNRLSQVFDKIYDPICFRCGCVKKS